MVEDSPETSRHHQDQVPADISADELSTNAPANETEEVKSQRRARNAKRAERCRCLAELPICNLNNTLDEVTGRQHTTPEQCLHSINIIGQSMGVDRATREVATLAEKAFFMVADNHRR